MHTHDDIVVEVDEAKAEAARAVMQGTMRSPSAWAAGFPLFAKVDVMVRYGKG